MYGTHTDTTVSLSSVAKVTLLTQNSQIFSLTWPPAFSVPSNEATTVVRILKSNHVYRVGVVYEMCDMSFSCRFCQIKQ